MTTVLYCSQVLEAWTARTRHSFSFRCARCFNWWYWSNRYIFLHCARNWARMAEDWWEGVELFLVFIYFCWYCSVFIIAILVVPLALWMWIFCKAWLQADMYSLGVVFFELWHPFGTAMERHVVLSDLKQKGELPAAWVAEFSEQASLLRRLLSSIPADRPSATELLQDAFPPRMEYELLDSK